MCVEDELRLCIFSVKGPLLIFSCISKKLEANNQTVKRDCEMMSSKRLCSHKTHIRSTFLIQNEEIQTGQLSAPAETPPEPSQLNSMTRDHLECCTALNPKALPQPLTMETASSPWPSTASSSPFSPSSPLVVTEKRSLIREHVSPLFLKILFCLTDIASAYMRNRCLIYKDLQKRFLHWASFEPGVLWTVAPQETDSRPWLAVILNFPSTTAESNSKSSSFLKLYFMLEIYHGLFFPNVNIACLSCILTEW